MLFASDTLAIVVAALIFDALIGDPDWIWRRVPHPVVWIGKAIDALEQALNVAEWSPQQRKIGGIGAVLWLVIGAMLIGLLIEIALPHGWIGTAVKGLLASVLLAQRSLYQHVARVRDAFADGGLGSARQAVARIVGRDPERLDAAGVSRAAIESTAENFSDGIVAPVFWLALLGLPGLIAYKAINTADSMIGHRSPRYESFGWAAARLDDLVNLVPARLSGLLIALVAPIARGSFATAFHVMLRDASKHRSPNAGWPESAMAGALGIALAGPRAYAEGAVDDPFLNAEARKAATPTDIGRALQLFVAACALQAMIYAALAVLL
ncbi:adenosylcobinamide-phosphate synthase CbiB [Rhodopseudomonas sp. P2A-2r]|uniref:adenosylcobinamide-phosphate synthase CbiB n=1 Tax=unclassified Rhodopseudomonas TaxID=2638247 RepID=UPI002233F935|nr:adenosylcobinamide-phosphate synthase CbiB [Rhodopseudomonas sp. P2A-2r]UZE47803.1 adenosylcobinamide-phosphate synthase CbiB [Rhodopseudomonas sp. P2A-2r]